MGLSIWHLDGHHIIVDGGGVVICERCPCPDCLEVVQRLAMQAASEGTPFATEGVLVHRRAGCLSVYDPRPDILFLLCLDKGDYYWVIDCNCRVRTFDKSYQYPGFERPVDDWYLPIEMPGVCTCFDIRQLILENPDRFGVVDYSWGSHTTYSYTNRYENNPYNPMDPTTPYVETGSVLIYRGSVNGYGEGGYIDYRTLVVNISACGKNIIETYTPDPWHGSFTDISRTYDEAELTGHALLFRKPTEDDEQKHFIGGETYSAQFQNEWGDLEYKRRFPTAAAAEAFNEQVGIHRNENVFFLHNYNQVAMDLEEVEMNCTPEITEAWVEYDEDADEDEDEWIAHPSYEKGYAFVLCFIRTNEGCLRKSTEEFDSEIYIPSQKEILANCDEDRFADYYGHDSWGHGEHGTILPCYIQEDLDCANGDTWRNPDLPDETLDEGENDEGENDEGENDEGENDEGENDEGESEEGAII